MIRLENTPTLHTERLLLRKFTEKDIPAVLRIYSDDRTNTFLPWFPIKTLPEAEALLRETYLKSYEHPSGYRYALCLKSDNIPLGYVHVSPDESHDFGYGLRSDFWRQGLATEACLAVAGRLKEAGYPYITATHDVQNPRSGEVMKKLGMTYRYSYEEQWQPKNIPVIFRLYQLNFDGQDDRTYRLYGEQSARMFVEDMA